MPAITVQRAFEFVHDTNAVSAYRPQNLNRLNEFTVPGNVHDARYKMHVKASTNDARSAIVEYMGTRYYVAHDYPTGAIKVERA